MSHDWIVRETILDILKSFATFSGPCKWGVFPNKIGDRSRYSFQVLNKPVVVVDYSPQRGYFSRF
jgi:hypothetical protein